MSKLAEWTQNLLKIQLVCGFKRSHQHIITALFFLNAAVAWFSIFGGILRFYPLVTIFKRLKRWRGIFNLKVNCVTFSRYWAATSGEFLFDLNFLDLPDGLFVSSYPSMGTFSYFPWPVTTNLYRLQVEPSWNSTLSVSDALSIIDRVLKQKNLNIQCICYHTSYCSDYCLKPPQLF